MRLNPLKKAFLARKIIGAGFFHIIYWHIFWPIVHFRLKLQVHFRKLDEKSSLFTRNQANLSKLAKGLCALLFFLTSGHIHVKCKIPYIFTFKNGWIENQFCLDQPFPSHRFIGQHKTCDVFNLG